MQRCVCVYFLERPYPKLPILCQAGHLNSTHTHGTAVDIPGFAPNSFH